MAFRQVKMLDKPSPAGNDKLICRSAWQQIHKLLARRLSTRLTEKPTTDRIHSLASNRINQPTPTFRAAPGEEESGSIRLMIQTQHELALLQNLTSQAWTFWDLQNELSQYQVILGIGPPVSLSYLLPFMFLSFLGPMNFNNGPMHMRACTT